MRRGPLPSALGRVCEPRAHAARAPRAWLLLLLLLGASPAALAQPRMGPLSVRTQHPLHLLYLAPRPARAQPLSAGTLDITVEAAVSNLVERTPITGGWELDLDLEIWRFVLATRFSPLDGLDLGLELALLRFDAGFLDGTVDGWHRAIGVAGGRRESLPYDRYSYRVAPGLVERYDLAEVPLGLSDSTLDLRVRLLDGGDWARRGPPTLALQVATKLPTGSWREGLGSGAPDLGAWLLLEHGGRVLVLHGSIGVVVPGPSPALDDLQVPVVVAWGIAGELRFAPSLSVLAQVGGATPRLEGMLASNETGLTLDLAIGVRGAACGWSWQVAFVEDLITLGPSVDFTALASVGRTLAPAATRRPGHLGSSPWTGRRCRLAGLPSRTGRR